MTDNISKKNKKDWENFLSSSEKLHDKDLTANSNKTNISKSLDLHGFSLEEANKKVESFLNSWLDRVLQGRFGGGEKMTPLYPVWKETVS